MSKPRTIILLAGLAAVVVTVAVGLSWKQIYYAIWPEARFWGRWEIVEPKNPGALEGFIRMDATLEFRKSGEMVAEAAAIEPVIHRYRVSRDRVVLNLFDFRDFDGRIDSGRVQDLEGAQIGWIVIDGAYHFETGDSVTIWSPWGHQNRIILRRLADTEDSEP